MDDSRSTGGTTEQFLSYSSNLKDYFRETQEFYIGPFEA